MKSLIYLLYLSFLIFGSLSLSAQNLNVWEQKINRDLSTNDTYAGQGYFVHENSPQQYVVMSSAFPYNGNSGHNRWM